MKSLTLAVVVMESLLAILLFIGAISLFSTDDYILGGIFATIALAMLAIVCADVAAAKRLEKKV